MADSARYLSSGVAERDKQTISLTEKQFDAAQFFKLSLGDIGIPEDQVINKQCVENNGISIGFMKANNMESIPVKEIYRIADEKGPGSYHAQSMKWIKKTFFIPEREINTDKLQDENFVLIIDEVNRGNVLFDDEHRIEALRLLTPP